MMLDLKKISKKMLMLLVFTYYVFIVSMAQNDLKKVISLEGTWKFSIGTNDDWKLQSFDDSDWDRIRVPSSWEDEGFQDYNGFAYYRKSVNISKDYEGQMLYLVLGYIDDVDEVYFNGRKIGSTGSFPPRYQTAYNAFRKYFIPEDLVRYDQTNVIAVKVYDSELAGGIVSGDVGIYTTNFGVKMDVNLLGSWNFHIGDNFDWKAKVYNDADWDKIFVPSKWEDQGFKKYDGYAWYRKQFLYTGALPNENMVIIMGRIDDADQVFINGILVGTTGNMPKVENKRFSTNTEWRAFRGYYFPSGLLKKDEINTIAVRVFDQGGEGGIYEGPVGIISQTKYIKYWRERKRQKN